MVLVLQARHVSWYFAVGCSSIALSADLCHAGVQFRNVQQKHASICSIRVLICRLPRTLRSRNLARSCKPVVPTAVVLKS
jgi:hypothetical protein